MKELLEQNAGKIRKLCFWDFVGNILRHGPLDMIRVKEPGDDSDEIKTDDDDCPSNSPGDLGVSQEELDEIPF